MVDTAKKFSLIFFLLIGVSVLSLLVVAILTPLIVDQYATEGVSLTKLPVLVKYIRGFDLIVAIITTAAIVSISALLSWLLTVVNKVFSLLGLIVISILIVLLTVGTVAIEYYSVM